MIKELTHHFTDYSCASGYVKCANELQCIPESEICDDNDDCQDESDELCYDECLDGNLTTPAIVK